MVFVIDNGFYEVINDPFTEVEDNRSIKLDNPLDSNKSCMRTDLESSLVENLTYNERRQKDSIKFFEISDVYSLKTRNLKEKLELFVVEELERIIKIFQKKLLMIII